LQPWEEKDYAISENAKIVNLNINATIFFGSSNLARLMFIFVNIVGKMFGVIVEIFDNKFYGCIQN
jgi:hypothetical protein